MSSERISVALLARELGLRPNKLMDYAKDLGMPRVRVAATFSASEANQLREFDARKREAAARAVRAGAGPRPVQLNPRGDHGLTETQPCDCCGLAVPLPAVRCSICQTHFRQDAEPAERRDDRLADHRRRLAAIYSPSAAELTENRDRMHAALRSRDSWRTALVEVMVHHEEGDEGCLCGAKHYPCESVATLERVNRGIARQVENYLSMEPEAMRDALYGDRFEIDYDVS